MTYSIVNIILVVVTVTLSNGIRLAEARNGKCPNPTTGETQRYDTSSEVCCGGGIFPIRRGARPRCCGNGIYNPRDEICCGGEVKSRSDGEQCCDFTEWYNPETFICCGSNVHQRKNGRFECCGSAKYNTLKETCCPVEQDGDITMATLPGIGECCGNRLIDPKREMCCNGVAHVKTNQFTQCCGNSTYNKMTEMCCSNKSPYNPQTQICCEGNVHSADNSAQCCGLESYLSSQSSCCNNNLFRGIPEMPNLQACCGGISYFKTDHVCCQDTLHARRENIACCGQDTYNTTTGLCCSYADESTAVLEKTSPNDECCGLSTYDPTSQTCCEMASRSFDNVVGGECCGTDPEQVRAYDPAQATCCRGTQGEILHDVPTGHGQCCDAAILSENELCDPVGNYPVLKAVEEDDAVCFSVTYNTATQVCMEDGTIEVLSRTLAVCGMELYDPTAEVCCDEFIRGRFDEDGYERECCPGTTISFTPAFQTCCMSTVHDIPSADSGCCRNTAYSRSTEMCDERGIIRTLSELADYPELCGDIPYHPDEYTCCGYQLIGADQICCMGYPATLPYALDPETGECCGMYAFNPSTQICCSGTVHMKATDDASCCGWSLLTDLDTQICCNGHLHDQYSGLEECDGHVAYNPLTETVCNGWVFDLPNGECCSSQAFEPSTHICCGGEIYPKTSETTECCGREIYETDDSTHICCTGHLHRADDGTECCGHMTYNPSTETCCMNDLFPFTQSKTANSIISCCDTATHQSTQHTCCGGVEHKFISDGECCGMDVIRNPDEQFCCGGNVWPRYPGQSLECCGGKTIDLQFQTCCNGTVLYLGEPQECCGGNVINTYIQTCCGGDVHMINDEEVECCDGTSFSNIDQGCCGTQIFNRTTEICSEGELVSPQNTAATISTVDEFIVNESDSILCDEQEYDPLTQTCCGNFVFDVRDDFICCNGQPSDASSGKTSCCVDTPYNPTRFHCCQGELHHIVDGALCCGRSYYQPTKETCCDDAAVVSHGEGCPNNLPVSENVQDTQCLCNLKYRGDQISSACANRLRTKQRIYIAFIADIEDEDDVTSYIIEPIDPLRGVLPVSSDDDADGRFPMTLARHGSCDSPTLRVGQRIVVFMDAEVDLNEPIVHLTRNDVILPYNRRLVRQLTTFLE